ncbi:HORMA domain superfamily [Sesbania bispinosa]|nr:HORMA domain superfamily [Sesbania bispinosa]
MEQIVSEFLMKSLNIILESRVPSFQPHHRSGDDSSQGSRLKRICKWFNLALGVRPAPLDNLNFWHKNLKDPVVIDIILAHERTGSSVETVIERWVVHYECPQSQVIAPQTGEITNSHRKTYKKLIVLLRSLYSQMRLLPAYKIFKKLSRSSQTCNFDIIYKVSSCNVPLSQAEGGMLEEYKFTPVEALPGWLCISVTYNSKISDFNLESSMSLLPSKIINDYVGSPNTDSFRSFHASEKSVCATSFPQRKAGAGHLSSVPFQHSHSRFSCQDDGVGDISYPFDVGDYDTPDVQLSHNMDGKSASKMASTSLPRGICSQSQNAAAIGSLVHMLRTAPPLRRDSSWHSIHSEGGVTDALEELRSYRDIISQLSKNGGSVHEKR